MAVNKVPVGCTLKLSFQTGVDGSGNPVLRSKSLNNVKVAASDQAIYDTAAALANLQANTLCGLPGGQRKPGVCVIL